MKGLNGFCIIDKEVLYSIKDSYHLYIIIINYLDMGFGFLFLINTIGYYAALSTIFQYLHYIIDPLLFYQDEGKMDFIVLI